MICKLQAHCCKPSPTIVKKLEYGKITFPKEIWNIYRNFIADLGNDFLAEDLGPRERTKTRCDNYRKTVITRAAFVTQYDTVEERAHVMMQERLDFVETHRVSQHF